MNSNRGIGVPAAIVLAAIASLFINLEPMIARALGDGFHFSTGEVGLLLSVESTMAIPGGLLFAFAVKRAGSAPVRTIGIVLFVLANAATPLTNGLGEMLATRALSGLAEGIMMAAAFALIARSSTPSRAFGGFGIVQMIFSIDGFLVLAVMRAGIGRNAPFVLLAIFGIAALALIPFFDDTQQLANPHRVAASRLRAGALLGISSILVFFTTQAAIWPYLERIGAVQGVNDFTIVGGLSFGALCGLLGSIAATALPTRLTGPAMLVAVSAFNIGTLAIFLLGHSPQTYLVALGTFNFAWTLYMPLQLGLLRQIDAQPNVFAIASVVTNAGFAIGPLLGAALTRGDDYALVFGLDMAGTVIATALLLIAPRLRRGPIAAGATQTA